MTDTSLQLVSLLGQPLGTLRIGALALAARAEEVARSRRLAKRTALEGLQMMGGYGYATEYDMEAHVRHTLVTTIYGGASEIQREIIARSLGL